MLVVHTTADSGGIAGYVSARRSTGSCFGRRPGRGIVAIRNREWATIIPSRAASADRVKVPRHNGLPDAADTIFK